MTAPLAAGKERPTLTGRMQIDAADRAFRLALVLPVLVATVVMVLYYLAQPHWLADPDAQDYAQLGRQLAAGRGPTTRFMPWNGLDFLAGRGDQWTDAAAPSASTYSWPNIGRFPLTPLLMSVSFAVNGPNDDAVHLPAALAFVLTAGCSALLAARLAGPWVGLTAGLTAAFLPLFVNYSLTGLTEPLLGLLIVAVVACVVRAPAGSATIAPGSRADVRLLLLGGVLLGLAILNRYDTAILAVAMVGLWLLPRPDRWQASVRFLAPAAIIVAPWALYLLVEAGTPLFNLQPASIAAQSSGRADGLGWYLPEYVSPAQVWLRDPSRALRIAIQEVAGTPNHLRKLLGWPWLLAGLTACLLALAHPLLTRARLSNGVDGERAERSWRRWLGGTAALAIFLLVAVLLRALLASVLGLNLQRHFMPLVPLLLVLVACEADWLVRMVAGLVASLPGASRGVLLAGRGIVAALLIGPSVQVIGPFLAPPSEPPGPPTRSGEVEARPENLARLAEIVDPGALVASNVPWSVAWQADRRAVPLPPSVEDTAELEQRFGITLDAIYVAGQVSIADAPRSWRTWDDLRKRGTPPPGYILAESFENGGRLFLKQR
ncbi:MAG: ArnT family glycosyltransferase [Chloroflexota bacterium]